MRMRTSTRNPRPPHGPFQGSLQRRTTLVCFQFSISAFLHLCLVGVRFFVLLCCRSGFVSVVLLFVFWLRFCTGMLVADAILRKLSVLSSAPAATALCSCHWASRAACEHMAALAKGGEHGMARGNDFEPVHWSSVGSQHQGSSMAGPSGHAVNAAQMKCR